jgi:hypothetical protein
MIFTPTFKSTVYKGSVLILSGVLLCLANHNIEPACADTSDSAVNNTVTGNASLQWQNGTFSTIALTDKALADKTAEDKTLADQAPLPGMVQNDNPFGNTALSTDVKTFAQPNSLEPSIPISLRRIVPIALESAINSKFIRVGDKITAKLKEDLYYGRLLVAPVDSILEGRIISIRNSRTLCQATFKNENRFNSNAAVEIVFDTIRPANQNYFIPINAKPAHQKSARTTPDKLAYGMAMDNNGRIIQAGRTLTDKQKNVYNTLRVATMVPLPGGLITNLGGAPIIMTTVGAASPDIVFNRPIDQSVSHRRLKGLSYGFVTSLPGAFFVQAVVEKGSEIILSKGDELMIDITINNQLLPQTPSKPPDALVVKAKLLDEKILPQEHADLPLKPSMESNINDDSSEISEKKTEATQTVISGLESQISD